MWKPDHVVPEHKNRARLVWGGLLLAVLAYAVWQITTVAVQRANPGTSLVLSNELYRFPHVLVCLYDRAGCGYADGTLTGCVSTALQFSYAQYGNYLIESATSEREGCLAFDLTTVDVGEGERNSKATAFIEMNWISSDNASVEFEYSTSVDVYLGDVNGYGEDFITIPYSRNVHPNEAVTFHTTAMTIGKTQRSYISGPSSTTYPVLTLSTTSYVTKNNIFSSSSSYFTQSDSAVTIDVASEYSVGTLYLDITQGSYSLTKVKDVDPLELGTLLGNIGGFWELLVLAWGLCFISNSRESNPTLKARNFSKSLQRGGSVITRTNSRKRISKASSSVSRGTSARERPDWDDVYISSGSDTGGGEQHHQRGRFPRDARVSPSSTRPVSYPLPKRVSASSLGDTVSGRMSSRGIVSNLSVTQRYESPANDHALRPTICPGPGPVAVSSNWRGMPINSQGQPMPNQRAALKMNGGGNDVRVGQRPDSEARSGFFSQPSESFEHPSPAPSPGGGGGTEGGSYLVWKSNSTEPGWGVRGGARALSGHSSMPDDGGHLSRRGSFAPTCASFEQLEV